MGFVFCMVLEIREMEVKIDKNAQVLSILDMTRKPTTMGILVRPGNVSTPQNQSLVFWRFLHILSFLLKLGKYRPRKVFLVRLGDDVALRSIVDGTTTF